jgi:hypothetical protein
MGVTEATIRQLEDGNGPVDDKKRRDKEKNAYITDIKLQKKKEREREANIQLILRGIKQIGYNKRTLAP